MTNKNKTIKLPKKYIPKSLSKKDRKKWASEINKTHKAYKSGKYLKRKNVKTHKNKQSPHIKKAKSMYKIENMSDLKKVSKKVGCSKETLEKIYKKGSGAWFSGSRPNQTQQSWALARVASAITGGGASWVDKNELINGCKKNSKALKLMRKKRNKKTAKRKVKI